MSAADVRRHRHLPSSAHEKLKEQSSPSLRRQHDRFTRATEILTHKLPLQCCIHGLRIRILRFLEFTNFYEFECGTEF